VLLWNAGRFLIEAHLREGRTIAELAAAHGVHRSWLYKLLARYRAEGEAGLAPRPRRPGPSPLAMRRATEYEIVRLRRRHLRAGLDGGALTLHWHLVRRHGTAPSVSSIWRLLRRRGLVTPEPHKRPRSSLHRFEAALPNELWQIDATHWQLAGGAEVEILNVIDDHSRVRGGSDRLEDLTRHSVSHEADDIEAVRRALDLERFALLGWSYPGFVAALYAARHPERVSHLVLVCPVPPYQDPAWPAPAIAPELGRQLEELRKSPIWEADQAEACRRATRLFASFRMRDQEKAAQVRIDRCELPNEWPTYAWRMGRQVQSTLFDIRDQLGAIAAATLVFHGDEDAIPREGAESWARLISGARLIRRPRSVTTSQSNDPTCSSRRSRTG